MSRFVSDSESILLLTTIALSTIFKVGRGLSVTEKNKFLDKRKAIY